MDKVKSLEDDLDITSNYTCHLIDQEEKEMQQKQGGRIRVVESIWKRHLQENKTMKAEIVKLADDNIKLRQDFQQERNKKVTFTADKSKEMSIQLVKQGAQIEGVLEQVKHDKENFRLEKEDLLAKIKCLEENNAKLY